MVLRCLSLVVCAESGSASYPQIVYLGHLLDVQNVLLNTESPFTQVFFWPMDQVCVKSNMKQQLFFCLF